MEDGGGHASPSLSMSTSMSMNGGHLAEPGSPSRGSCDSVKILDDADTNIDVQREQLEAEYAASVEVAKMMIDKQHQSEELLDSLRDELAALRDQHDDERDDASKQIGELESTIRRLHVDLSVAQSNATDFERKLREATKSEGQESRAYEGRISDMMARARHSEQAISDLRVALANSGAELEDLRRDLAHSNSVRETVCRDLKDTQAKLSTMMSNADKDTDVVTAQLRSQVQKLEKDVNALQQSCRKLKSDNSSFSSQLEKTTISSMHFQSRSDELSRLLNSANEELKRFRSPAGHESRTSGTTLMDAFMLQQQHSSPSAPNSSTSTSPRHQRKGTANDLDFALAQNSLMSPRSTGGSSSKAANHGDISSRSQSISKPSESAPDTAHAESTPDSTLKSELSTVTSVLPRGSNENVTQNGVNVDASASDNASLTRSLSNEFNSVVSPHDSGVSSVPSTSTSEAAAAAAATSEDTKLDDVTLESLVKSGILSEKPQSAEELLTLLKKSKSLRSALLARTDATDDNPLMDPSTSLITKSVNREFFYLTCLSAKINASLDTSYSLNDIDCGELFDEASEEHIPFHNFHDWIVAKIAEKIPKRPRRRPERVEVWGQELPNVFPVEGGRYTKYCSVLLTELHEATLSVIRQFQLDSSKSLTDSCYSVVHFTMCLERCLCHGIRQGIGSYFGYTNIFWDFLREGSEILQNRDFCNDVNIAKTLPAISTGWGRGRAFLRLAAKHQSLHRYFYMLLRSQRAQSFVKGFYKKDSIICSCAEELLAILHQVNEGIRMDLRLNDEKLHADNFWQISDGFPIQLRSYTIFSNRFDDEVRSPGVHGHNMRDHGAASPLCGMSPPTSPRGGPDRNRTPLSLSKSPLAALKLGRKRASKKGTADSPSSPTKSFKKQLLPLKSARSFRSSKTSHTDPMPTRVTTITAPTLQKKKSTKRKKKWSSQKGAGLFSPIGGSKGQQERELLFRDAAVEGTGDKSTSTTGNAES